MMKKAMLYLGLGSDEDFHALDQGDYDRDYQSIDLDDGYDEDIHLGPEQAAGTHRSPMNRPVGGLATAPSVPAQSSVRMLAPEESPVVEERPHAAQARPAQSVVRTIPAPATATPHVVAPVTFNEAQEVADKYKVGQPVLMNLQGANRDLSRRMIDFTSGLCYGLGGNMKKVAEKVYLLSPNDVEVSHEERSRLRAAGLHD